jgi:alpha-galactosidase
MLEVGNGGMTTAEYRSEFSLWAAMDAPLIAGTDLRKISPTDLAIYTNQQVIAVDQDKLGKQAVPIAAGGDPAGDNGLWVLSKPLSNGDRAVVLFNSTGSAATVSTTSAEVGLPKARDYGLNDLWAHTSTETAGAITAQVPAHGAVLYRVSTSAGNAAPNVTLSATSLAGAAPGTPTSMTTSMTNNGRTTVKQATLSVTAPSGWKVTGTGPTTFTDLATGATATAKFTVTAAPPTAPIQTSTVTANAAYSWAGQHGTASTAQTVPTVSPVQAPYLTYSSATEAQARYGQVGDDFAVSGAGTDLWNDNDNYSTIYRAGAVGPSSTVQTEVTSTSNLAGYAKAGILVRNAMTTAGTGTEGVILYVSPSGGIQLEWNSNGDTSIDSVTPGNGTIAATVPVYLKLVRSGSSYTGYYSTDNQNWTTVGSATVPGQADTQDAGLFVVSASAGASALIGYHGLTIS